MKQRTVFIVGGAGYIGEMLCEQFGKRGDVRQIIALDKEPQSEYSKKLPKLIYIHQNMADDGWQNEVAKYEPDTVIHTAWQIRAMYGRRKLGSNSPPTEEYEQLAAQRLRLAPNSIPASLEQWRWNVEGTDKVFDLALRQPSVEKLIYFSTAASYSARADNTFEHYFTEEEGFRDDDYIYAREKKVSEEHLNVKYERAKKEGKHIPQITVVRPAAVTGPRGRFMRIRFGLQSVLQGNLKGGFVNRIVTLLTSFVPATKGWVRQFIHEDDVTDIIMAVTFADQPWEYEVFNITPDSEPVFAADMARAVGKKVLPIQPWMARLAFWFFWHATRGRIPTCPGSWRFYSYPVLMSGKKLKQIYACTYTSKEAFQYTDGRYADWVPEGSQRPKPTA